MAVFCSTQAAVAYTSHVGGAVWTVTVAGESWPGSLSPCTCCSSHRSISGCDTPSFTIAFACSMARSMFDSTDAGPAQAGARAMEVKAKQVRRAGKRMPKFFLFVYKKTQKNCYVYWRFFKGRSKNTVVSS